jgi:hypothetical protein
MQGPSELDLARTLAREHLRNSKKVALPPAPSRNHAARHWLGSRLIQLGEVLTPQPTESRLKASTGPPYQWD